MKLCYFRHQWLEGGDPEGDVGVRRCEQTVLEDLQPVGPQLEALRVRIRTVSMEDGVWAWGESALGVPGIGVDRQPNIHILK